MAMIVSESFSVTLGNGAASLKHSSPKMMTTHAKRSSSCVISNSSSSPIANVLCSMKTIMPSGQLLVSIMSKIVPQLAVLQSIMSVAAELTSHSNGLDLTTGNVAQTEPSWPPTTNVNSLRRIWPHFRNSRV